MNSVTLKLKVGVVQGH